MIQAKYGNLTLLETDKNYVLKARPAFTDNNLNLTFYTMLITKDTLYNKTLPFIISNNFDNKICISKDIAIDLSEVNSNDSYSISEIALTARYNDLKTDAQKFQTQKTYTVNTHSGHLRPNTNKNNNTIN